MDFDVVVIGGGPAGYVASIRLAQLGKKTILIEKEELGGECLNHGCIPVKALLDLAGKFWSVKNMFDQASTLVFDMSIYQRRKETSLKRLRDGIAYLLRENGVKILKGFAKVKGEREVSVLTDGGERIIKASRILWAVGSEHLDIEGVVRDGKSVLSPREVLSLDKLPKSITIIGGGAVGLELATAFSKLGSKVYIVEIMNQVLPGFSIDIASIIQRSLKKLGVEIFTSSKVTYIEKLDGKVYVNVEMGKESLKFESDVVMVSAGRKASTQNRDLASIGVKLDGKGFVIVDKNMRTSIESIYSAGDATGPPLLAHKASRQALIAAESIANLEAKIPIYPIPIAIFTDPEVAIVGMSEEEARASGYDVKIGKFPFSALGRAVAQEQPEGFVKIVFDGKDGTIIGAQIVGQHASELISFMELVILKRLRLDDLESVIYPHPTFSEAIGEVASYSLMRPIHMLRKQH